MINKKDLVNSLENLWGFRKKIIQFKFNSKDLLRNANKNFGIGMILGSSIYGLGFIFQNIYPGNYIFTGYLNFFYICYLSYILLDYLSTRNIVKHLNYVNDWMDDILINKSEVISLFKKHLENEKVSEAERVSKLLKLQNVLGNYEKETEQFQIEKIEILKIYSKLLSNELETEMQNLKANQELKNREELESIFNNMNLDNIDKSKIKNKYLLEGNSRDEYSFFKNNSNKYFSKKEIEILKSENIFRLISLFNPDQCFILFMSIVAPATFIYEYGKDENFFFQLIGVSLLVFLNIMIFWNQTISKYRLRKKVKKFIEENLKTPQDIISLMLSAENIFENNSELEDMRKGCKNYLAYKAGLMNDKSEEDMIMSLIHSYIRYVEENEKNNELLVNKSRLKSEMLNLIEGETKTLHVTK